MKQKGDDYKISAVKYYLNNNDTMANTCKIFNCKKPSLHRWIQIYKTKKYLQRKPRISISYKNIYKIALKAINKLERPSYLCRESNQALKPSCYKQTLQWYEKTQP
jgi:transposase-like protein